MIDEEELDGILDTAKRIVTAQGDTNPTFIIRQDEGLIVVDIPFESDDKDKVVEIITQLVAEAESTRYYFIFTGWSVQEDEAKQMAEVELRKMMQKSITKKSDKKKVVELLLAHSGQLRPSENPFRSEQLMVCRFDKQLGSDVVSIELKRPAKNKVVFGEKKNLSGNMYMRFNIWNAYQVDLNEVERNEKENGK